MFDTKIDLFLDTVEEGSFSAAAKKNYVSQSAVSQSVSKLEQELGFILFNRKSYRPTLTSSGKYYYEAIKQLKMDHEKIIKNAKRLSLSESKIVIGISNAFEKKHIPKIVGELKKENSFNINIKKCSPLEGIELLKNKKINICLGMKVGFESESEIACIPYYSGKVCIVVSKNHPLSKYKEVNIKQVKDEPVVVLRDVIAEKTYDSFMNGFRLDGYIPNIIKECDDLEDFFMSVRFGEGIGFTIEELVINQEDIAAIPLKDSHHKSILAIGYLKEESNENILMTINKIQEYFQRL